MDNLLQSGPSGAFYFTFESALAMFHPRATPSERQVLYERWSETVGEGLAKYETAKEVMQRT